MIPEAKCMAADYFVQWQVSRCVYDCICCSSDKCASIVTTGFISPSSTLVEIR